MLEVSIAEPLREKELIEECIFCNIANGRIPVTPVYEDEEFFAFRDSNPQAPVHVLVVPKKHYPCIIDIEDVGLLGRAMSAVKLSARLLNLEDEGFRVVLNTRDNGGQTVRHVHFHILGGRFMQWPPG